MWGSDTEACCAVDSRHRSLERVNVERDRFLGRLIPHRSPESVWNGDQYVSSQYGMNVSASARNGVSRSIIAIA